MKNQVNIIKYSFLFILFITFNYSLTIAQHGLPKLQPLVEIGKLKIKNTNKNQIELGFPVYVFKNGKAKLKIHSTGASLNYNGNQYKNALEKDVSLVKNQGVETTLFLEPDDKENILISVFYEFPDAPHGYKKEYTRYYKLVKSDNEYFIFDPRGSTDLKPKEVKTIKGGLDNNKLDNFNKLNSITQNYTVNVSGKITVEFRNKGLYGNGVSLWFRNSSNPGTWYHPVIGNNQHTHYDILDEQGNFNFNFNFSGDLSGYNELIVVVNTANAATYLPAPADGYVVWENNGYTSYFNESEGILAAVNGTNSNIIINQNGTVNFEYGSVLRYTMLSKNHVINLYGGNVPFNINPISARVTDLSVAGHFVIEWTPNGYVHYIEIDPNSTEFTTVSHEYGHYINFCMWGRSKFSDASTHLKEGWSIFYSFGVRNYGNKLYGDDLRSNDDNTETAPFTTPTRYNNIRYAYHGEPYKAATGCYLWSLYDNYTGGNLEAPTYSAGDNDDISGYSLAVFETMRTLTNTTVTGYHSFIVVALNSNEVNSANDINQFMFDDLYSVPSYKMRSAQVTDFSKEILSSSQVKFTWNPQSYSGTPSYGNYENGYKLYYKNGSSWQLFSTIPFGQNNYTYNSANIVKEYKITSYNNTGESSNSKTLVIYPQAPIISSLTQDPEPICQGSSGYVYANLSQGNGILSYAWSVSNLPDGAYITPMGNKCKVTYSRPRLTKDNGQNEIMDIVNSITCTVSNSAGSDSENRNLYMSTSCNTCPTLAFENNGKIEDENPILSRSVISDGDVTDYYLIQKDLTLTDKRLNFIIHEPYKQHTYLDQVELLEIKVNPNEFAAVSEDGEIVNYKISKKALDFSSKDKEELGSQLSSKDDKKVQFLKGDTLTISSSAIASKDETEELFLLFDGEEPIYKESMVAALTIANTDLTTETESLYLRPQSSTVSFKLGKKAAEKITVEFLQDAKLDFISVVKNEKTAKVDKLTLIEAVHNERGNIENLLTGEDKRYEEIYPGEKIRFTFESKNSSDEKTAYILKTVGRYESGAIIL